MNRYTISTPEGSRDRLFSECEERRKVQRVLSDFYEKRGYSEVITPTLEYYDIFTRSGNSLSQETMFKVIDRGGRILVMRPDVTTPIARISATKLSNEVLPQRFYYIQNVYRSDLFHTGRRSEIAQAGIELVGSSGLKADVEVISMAIDSLIACGYDNFYFGLGHSGIINALIGMLAPTRRP